MNQAEFQYAVNLAEEVDREVNDFLSRPISEPPKPHNWISHLKVLREKKEWPLI